MADALLVVDIQNDFCAGGSLAVPDGDAVVPVMNAYMARAEATGMPVYVSRDWHPAVTSHFAAYGGTWPPHCVQNTHGAELHSELRVPTTARLASKGMDPDDDGYSNIDAVLPDGSLLLDSLRAGGVTRVFVGGLATDYCVKATALDALKAGLAVVVLLDACRAVDAQPGDGERAIAAMVAAGARVAVNAELTAG
ncbi:MAG TPA: isochorismatase family protein [Ktedonobacterales bacterium]|nr:isochorismatase family protein [Ktedonobacterales bacterium]